LLRREGTEVYNREEITESDRGEKRQREAEGREKKAGGTEKAR